MNIIFLTGSIFDIIGAKGLLIMFILIFIIFGWILYTIIKRKRKAKQNLSAFSLSVQNMLSKLDTPEKKIRSLEVLINRINNDTKYAKTPEWKDSVLAKVYEHIASIYYQTNDEEGMIKACSQIIKYDPSNGMAYYNRGSIYSNRGEYQKALTDFNDALIILPQYASIYNNRGLVYDRLHKYEDALTDFNHAIELEPSAIAYYNRANLYFDKENLSDALSDYRMFLQLDTDNQYDLKEEVETIIKSINAKL